MNKSFLIGTFATLLLGLTACGGSSSDSKGRSLKDKPYGCIEPKDYEKHGIKLTGVTLENGCVSKRSTADQLVYELKAGQWMSINVDQSVQDKAFAQHLISTPDSTIKYINSSKLTPAQKDSYLLAINNKNVDKIVELVKRFKQEFPAMIEHSVRGNDVSVKYETSKPDFSYKVKFDHPQLVNTPTNYNSQSAPKYVFLNSKTDKEFFGDTNGESKGERARLTFTNGINPNARYSGVNDLGIMNYKNATKFHIVE